MHVKIQGGGEGVYANSGSCSAAAMYCEHERQELMRKGMRPETFFHQHSDFVSTCEVIDRIDHNKKHLRKEDAKFFVMTVSPSADEQRKMGDNLEDRIAAFKNYIRNGVMAQYAENFGRGLSADDIMYYAYVHVDRDGKEGEQMHAHIIISRRDMDNSISLSPKSNHRKGKGVIAHGFNRDQFSNNCEKAFDVMMDYSRSVEESYKYRNAVKNGSYEDVAQVTTQAIQEKYGVVSTSWDNLAHATFGKQAKTETKAPDYSPVPTGTPEPKTAVTETKVPEHQSTDSGIVGFAKKAWNYATGLFGKKTAKTVEKPGAAEIPTVKEEPKQQTSVQELKPVQPVQPSKDNMTSVTFLEKNGQFAISMVKNGKNRASLIDKADAEMYQKAQNGGNAEEFNKVCAYLENKYLKHVPEQDVPAKVQPQATAQELKPVQPERKKVPDGLILFKAKDKEYFSAAIYKDGKRCRYAAHIDKDDVAEFFKARNSGDKEYMKKVSAAISAKYFHEDLARKVAGEFRKNTRGENVTSAYVFRRDDNGVCGIRYTTNGSWSPAYRISDECAREINALPAQEIPVVFSLVNNLIMGGGPMAAGVSNMSTTGQKKKDDEDERKKRGLRR